jgi:hypothetical protein
VLKYFAAMQYAQISAALLPKIRTSAQVKSNLAAAGWSWEESFSDSILSEFNYPLPGS